MNDCVFCKIIKGELPSYKIYEDDIVLSFLSIDPYKYGHTLIIPKKHYVDYTDIDLETLKLIKKKYYMMPAEERADILGGVDREAALKLIYDNYEEHVDVNISVINKEKMS